MVVNTCLQASDPQRVVVVDNDTTEASRSVERLRLRYGPQLAVRHVPSVHAAMTALDQEGADLIIVDWSVPAPRQPADPALENGGDLPLARALSVLASLRRAAPDAALVVYSTGLSESDAVAALRGGAVECLEKDGPLPLERLVPLAWERHQQRRHLEAAHRDAAHRATHDPLTGLATRALFLEQLEHTLALNTRQGRPTGVLFVDLDGFKLVNDTRGHQQGDAILCAVADRLRSCVRRSDCVARLGGDEFVLLVPDAVGDNALQALTAQLQSLLRQPVPLPDGPAVTPGASIGSALAPSDGETPAALLAAADRAMYRVKAGRRHGRRRQRRGAAASANVQWSVSGSNR